MRILAIDGGGIRGVIAGRVLVEMEKVSGRPVRDLFDLLVGTSTGGILALGLASSDASGNALCSADQIVRLYTDNGPTIFPREGTWNWIQRHGAMFPRKKAKFAGNARYFPTGLETVLRSIFGDSRIGDLDRDVVIVCYDLKQAKPLLLRSSEARRATDLGPPLWQVARATSAGPTFFPPMPLSYGGVDRLCVDGGVAANNPAMIAYAEAFGTFEGDVPTLVSLGTGTPPSAAPELVTYESASTTGWVSLASSVMGMVFDGTSDCQDLALRALLAPDESYWRIQTELPGCSTAMDDATPANIACLKQAAENLVAHERGRITAVCEKLTA